MSTNLVLRKIESKYDTITWYDSPCCGKPITRTWEGSRDDGDKDRCESGDTADGMNTECRILLVSGRWSESTN